MPESPTEPTVGDAIFQEALFADEAHCAAARVDFAAFVTYVMRDEETGGVVELAPLHLEWMDLIDKDDRVQIWAHIESGKTNIISIARTLWEIGKDPSLRHVVLSNTYTQAEKIGRTIRRYIEGSAEYHRVFPHVVSGEGPWTDTSLTVKRPYIAKDPTVQCLGIHGNVLGARIDRLSIDDVLDAENTRTLTGMKELIGWYEATMVGRLTRRARVRSVGTAWNPDDLMHHLEKKPGWVTVRFPVVNERGESNWPERWSLEYIAKKEADLGPFEAARQLHCQARDDKTARFKRDWIERALVRGRGLYLLHSLERERQPAGVRVFTGCDLGVEEKDSADLTSLFTIWVYPNGDRRLINLDSGRWSGPEILRRILDVHRRFGAIILVESNGAQSFILQFARAESAVPVRPFHTGKNKLNPDFGIESLAVEFFNGKWILPSGDGGIIGMGLEKEVAAFVDEMLGYDPSGHTGDRLMAAWFSREAARAGPALQTGRIDILRR